MELLIKEYLKQLQNNIKKASERTLYYSLKTLIDQAMTGINAVIEEKENQVGIPDFTVRKNDILMGYIEAKKIGEDLDKIEISEQLQRYLDSSIGQNLILTNYLEFRWYIDGKRRLSAQLATIEQQKIIPVSNLKPGEELITLFLEYQGEIINNSSDLAQQMASYTRTIRNAINEGLKIENKTEELSQLQELFKDLLLPDLSKETFADMYAQTIAYGLFTARVNHSQQPKYKFERQTISLYLTDNIPFLKGLFNIVINTDAVSKIDRVIDLLIELLARVEMSNILENFGQATKQEDPVVHFYETFLAYYSANLRKSRGVYYTPEPVVNFMVKCVNDILVTKFNLSLGLANKDVTILDPATGTGTFLYAVIKQIYRNIEQLGMADQWSKYVKDYNLLDRLFGFELLMTPYTIAHLKLGLLLNSLGYQLKPKERLGIYLTNALDKGVKKSELIIGKIISDEGNKAADIKENLPILVVLGNPPYSGHSANQNSWINVKDYYLVDGVPLKEKNPKWLQDDYVKFIRFGQERIEKTGYGILAFITNHGYLDNPTFRGMRQNLTQTFDEIYLLDLHGNSKKKEVSPDGKVDKNVFDIQQGVAICIMIKLQKQKQGL
jgi:type I restriction-modification system DNA methylase subunit